jgi:hypothetical protein
MPIKLCVNCKKYIPKGIVVVNQATTREIDLCKKAINEVAEQDYVTGERTIPNLEAVRCRLINTAGECMDFVKKDAPWVTVNPKDLPVVVEEP